MAIYNNNQATVSHNHTKDCSRLSNEDDNVLSREHTICEQHQIQESEYCRPKQAPNLLSGQNLTVSILTSEKLH